MLIVFLLVSFFSSLVGSICGIGGGVIIKPVLDATGTMSVTAISFLSGCTVLSMSIISVAKAMKNSTVKINTKITTWLAIGSVLGGMTGKVMFQIVKEVLQNENEITFIKKYMNGIAENNDRILKTIEEKITGWSFERIGNVEKALLKISVYEILCEDTPHEIVINEAVELAKMYGDEKTSEFINGVLAKVVNS